jgi:hypothetical protein
MKELPVAYSKEWVMKKINELWKNDIIHNTLKRYIAK